MVDSSGKLSDEMAGRQGQAQATDHEHEHEHEHE
jgi:hypothetical protein